MRARRHFSSFARNSLPTYPLPSLDTASPFPFPSMFIQEAHVQKDIPREEDVTRPLSEGEKRRGEEVEVGGGGGSWPRNRKTLGNEKVMLRPATSPRASASSSDPQTCGGWTNNEPSSRGCLPGVGERRGRRGGRFWERIFAKIGGKVVLL